MDALVESKYANAIDLDRMVKELMGDRAKWIPGFFLSWMKKVLHQDDLNAAIWESRHLSGPDWLEWCVYDYLGLKVNVIGEENLPPCDDKRYVFVSNHPNGGPEGVTIGAVLGRRYDGKLKYLVNSLLMLVPQLAPFFIPINKTGAQSRNLSAQVQDAFESDNHVIMFPAGRSSRRQKDGSILDVAWKKTFVTKCVEYHRDVVPIHFSGRNSDFYYRLTSFTDKHLKTSIFPFLFQVDEMYKNRNKTLYMTVGEPIPWQTFDKSKTPAQWAAYVRDLVYKLSLKK